MIDSKAISLRIQGMQQVCAKHQLYGSGTISECMTMKHWCQLTVIPHPSFQFTALIQETMENLLQVLIRLALTVQNSCWSVLQTCGQV
jgi:hypothetical protein